MEYLNLLKDYKSGAEKFISKIKKLTDYELNFLPDRTDAWSIKEHIIHVVDSEVNGFIRLKSIIAQPNTECYVMDEDVWTKNLKRKNESLQDYMQLFEIIRKICYNIIIDEPEENWAKDYFVRFYKGEMKKITIAEWFVTYNNHLVFHLDFIDKILKEIK